MTVLPATDISIDTQPSRDRLTEIGVFDWPIWTKEISIFPWTYGESETCYFLEGDVIVTPAGGIPVQMGKGDLVHFPAGMSCTWEIRAAVKKHYTFGDE
ncbi:MAG: cupin domain-containing protein [Leptolyngbya sp. SIOISBB]|nr:cupin domain-containing protein [Leptolyngbya sp. SIOISBB]